MLNDIFDCDDVGTADAHDVLRFPGEIKTDIYFIQ
jgi:hypothetical protein